MEFMKGGSLAELLEREVRFLANEAAFYAAEIILCLEYLHS